MKNFILAWSLPAMRYEVSSVSRSLKRLKKILVLGDPEPGTSVKEIGQAFEKYSPIYVNLCFFI